MSGSWKKRKALKSTLNSPPALLSCSTSCLPMYKTFRRFSSHGLTHVQKKREKKKKGREKEKAQIPECPVLVEYASHASASR